MHHTVCQRASRCHWVRSLQSRRGVPIIAAESVIRPLELISPLETAPGLEPDGERDAMEVALSHASVIELPGTTPSRVFFPGRDVWQGLGGSFGFVRSTLRIQGSWRHRIGSIPGPLPWRDYPDEVLTNRSEVRFETGSGFQLTISARNCCNEFGSQCRLGGIWYGRVGDPELPPFWPVLGVGTGRQAEQLCVQSLERAIATDADLVTGLPVVIDCKPVSREFLIANASDVAHVFRVDPLQRFGPPAPAWQELTDGWVSGKAQHWSDQKLAASLQAIADRHGAERSDRLLHSIVGQRENGSIIVFGIHGALDQIAIWLAERWNVTNAIVLDNSGSVGWSYREPGDVSERLLLAGPNQRSRGSVFLAFDVGEHLKSASASEL